MPPSTLHVILTLLLLSGVSRACEIYPIEFPHILGQVDAAMHCNYYRLSYKESCLARYDSLTSDTWVTYMSSNLLVYGMAGAKALYRCTKTAVLPRDSVVPILAPLLNTHLERVRPDLIQNPPGRAFSVEPARPAANSAFSIFVYSNTNLSWTSSFDPHALQFDFGLFADGNCSQSAPLYWWSGRPLANNFTLVNDTTIELQVPSSGLPAGIYSIGMRVWRYFGGFHLQTGEHYIPLTRYQGHSNHNLLVGTSLPASAEATEAVLERTWGVHHTARPDGRVFFNDTVDLVLPSSVLSEGWGYLGFDSSIDVCHGATPMGLNISSNASTDMLRVQPLNGTHVVVTGVQLPRPPTATNNGDVLLCGSLGPHGPWQLLSGSIVAAVSCEDDEWASVTGDGACTPCPHINGMMCNGLATCGRYTYSPSGNSEYACDCKWPVYGEVCQSVMLDDTVYSPRHPVLPPKPRKYPWLPLKDYWTLQGQRRHHITVFAPDSSPNTTQYVNVVFDLNGTTVQCKAKCEFTIDPAIDGSTVLMSSWATIGLQPNGYYNTSFGIQVTMNYTVVTATLSSTLTLSRSTSITGTSTLTARESNSATLSPSVLVSESSTASRELSTTLSTFGTESMTHSTSATNLLSSTMSEPRSTSGSTSTTFSSTATPTQTVSQSLSGSATATLLATRSMSGTASSSFSRSTVLTTTLSGAASATGTAPDTATESMSASNQLSLSLLSSSSSLSESISSSNSKSTSWSASAAVSFTAPVTVTESMSASNQLSLSLLSSSSSPSDTATMSDTESLSMSGSVPPSASRTDVESISSSNSKSTSWSASAAVSLSASSSASDWHTMTKSISSTGTAPLSISATVSRSLSSSSAGSVSSSLILSRSCSVTETTSWSVAISVSSSEVVSTTDSTSSSVSAGLSTSETIGMSLSMSVSIQDSISATTSSTESSTLLPTKTTSTTLSMSPAESLSISAATSKTRTIEFSETDTESLSMSGSILPSASRTDVESISSSNSKSTSRSASTAFSLTVSTTGTAADSDTESMSASNQLSSSLLSSSSSLSDTATDGSTSATEGVSMSGSVPPSASRTDWQSESTSATWSVSRSPSTDVPMGLPYYPPTWVCDEVCQVKFSAEAYALSGRLQPRERETPLDVEDEYVIKLRRLERELSEGGILWFVYQHPEAVGWDPVVYFGQGLVVLLMLWLY